MLGLVCHDIGVRGDRRFSTLVLLKHLTFTRSFFGDLPPKKRSQCESLGVDPLAPFVQQCSIRQEKKLPQVLWYWILSTMLHLSSRSIRLGCIFLPESSGFLYFPFQSPVSHRNLDFRSAVILFFGIKRSKNLRSKTKAMDMPWTDLGVPKGTKWYCFTSCNCQITCSYTRNIACMKRHGLIV